MISPTNLFFRNINDDTALEAVFEVPSIKEKIIDVSWVKEQLTDAGHDQLFILEDAVDQIVLRMNSGSPGSEQITIAEKRDAEVAISISRDKLSAFLTIYPPLGGSPASLDQVKLALANKGIRHGFIVKAIKQAILTGEANDLLIAMSEPVIHGENAKFTCLLDKVKSRSPRIAENGNVDYRDLGDILVVHAGEKLMERISSTAGTASKNILGATLNPSPGKNTPYASGLDGVEISKSHPGILIATVTGQPIVAENGVNVENTMMVQDVNLSSGNVIFDGSVIIKGDVENGMKVHASGDINVFGLVECANLEAGGDIVVHGAIIGRGEVRDKKKQLNTETAILKAEGSITAKFAEQAYLQATNNIFIQDWVLKSELNAVNEIIVGGRNARKGQIIGGSISSGILVKAINVGSNIGVVTKITVGSTLNLERELEDIGRELSKLNHTLIDIQKAISTLKNNPTKQAQDMLKKTLLARKSIENQMMALDVKKNNIKTEQTRTQNAKLTVEKTIFAGVSISISGLKKEINEDLGRRSFRIIEGKVVQTQD